MCEARSDEIPMPIFRLYRRVDWQERGVIGSDSDNRLVESDEDVLEWSEEAFGAEDFREGQPDAPREEVLRCRRCSTVWTYPAGTLLEAMVEDPIN